MVKHLLKFYINKPYIILVVALSLAFVPSFALSAPWVDPGNERLRHHLQHLADAGHINTPLSTWPLTWASIGSHLDNIEPDRLTDSELWSYQFLQHEHAKATAKFSQRRFVRAGMDTPSITSFDTDSRQTSEVRVAVDFVKDAFSYRAQVGYVHNPSDFDPAYSSQTAPKELRFDGSFASMLVGNWALGVGSIDRWWGPGWQSSMILSHNARPSPGLFVQRHNPVAFETPWLSWIGPWQMTTFLNQLESERATPRARLWGLRINFRPLDSLEIGLSRTAQWGGEGRPQGLDVFKNLLLGNDNRGSSGIDDYVGLDSNEPGNQLAGVDWRWGLKIKDVSAAFYGQFIGEDEAGRKPSRGIGMAGIETGSLLFGTHSRLALEAANSIVNFYDDERRYGTAYKHPLYPSGYKHYQRSLASSYDGDSATISLRGDHYLNNGNQLSWQYSRLKLNHNNDARYSFAKVSTDNLQLSYHFLVSENLKVSAGVSLFTKAIEFNTETIDSSAFIAMTSSF